ncbi:MAG: hypothetical protein KA914_17680 [Ottowia sp.]|nr:hypothetical protein [Ottowia sp.]
MSVELDERLTRIEQLLLEGNELRRQGIALQNLALERQAPLLEEQRRQMDRAAQITDGAQALQAKARRLLTVVVPVILLCLVALLAVRLFV